MRNLSLTTLVRSGNGYIFLGERLRRNTEYKDEHWIYQGSKGTIRINYKLYLISRVSASIYLGLDLDDKVNQANHKCTEPRCWNPEHLYVGTQKDNVIDMYTKGERYTTHCPKDHEYTPENTYIIPNSGSRVCRICKREQRRKRYQVKHA